jgi:hypothetical protein
MNLGKGSTNPRLPNSADNKEQSKLFLEKAREIEADEERSAADDLMGRLARTPPQPKTKNKDR